MRSTYKKFLFPAAFAAAICLSAAICVGASAATFAPQVEGGQNASQGQAPWSSVALVVGNDSQGEFVCSGSVVAPDVVLTAGHCAVDANLDQVDAASGYTVMTGSVTWESDEDPSDSTPFEAGPGGALSGVSSVVAEPDFAYTDDGLADHDVALLELSTPSTAPVIRLATPADSGLYAANSSVQVAGWGVTSPNGDIPQNLQYASSILQSQSWCASSDLATFASADQVCIYSPDAGTCEGDSGGPVVSDSGSDYVEIGTTSYGAANDCSTTYDMNVSALDGWLSQEIGVLAPLGASTDAATRVTKSSATLNGSLTQVGSDASYQFEYGTTTNFGSITPTTVASGDSYAAAAITGLKPDTTYHYRLVVTDTNGPAVDGPDESFTTAKSPASSSSGSKASSKKPRAGTYRGKTSQHDRISLKVLSATKISGLSIRVGLRCTRAPGTAHYKLSPKGTHRVTAHGPLRFDGSFASGRDWHFRLAATFTTTGRVTGTLTVTGTHQRHGTCRSGALHWTAAV